MCNSVRSFAMASRMNASEMVRSSASMLSTVIQTLLNKLSLAKFGNSATIGLRSRNNAPCANRRMIAGQRDTSGSSRPRQKFVGRQPRIAGDDAGGDERPQVEVFCQYR